MHPTETNLSLIVTVILEETDTEIKVHKDVLCAHSDFAKACLRPGFREAEEGRIVVKDESDEESFRTLITWMYAGEAKIPETPDRGRFDLDEAMEKYWMGLTKLYIMADKYLMPGFKNDILGYWLCYINTEHSGSLSYIHALRLLHETGPARSGLKRLLIDYIVVDIHNQLGNGEFSFFITDAYSDWTGSFFKLIADRPELGSSILNGALRPEPPVLAMERYYEAD